MRDNNWLADRLHFIHQTHFADIAIENQILVRFGRKSRTRFGSIIAKPKAGFTKPVTFITINSLFKDEVVPEFVIDATLGHEFSHYTHGFHSPRTQLYKYPHQGDVVNKEMRKRGMGEVLELQEEWAKRHYPAFLRSNNLL